MKPGIKFTFGLIYLLLEKKLTILRNYLNENLKKRYIRPSIFPAGYFILFIKKKDGTYRLYIDFRHLNNITVKNRYVFFKIDKLLDRVQKAK